MLAQLLPQNFLGLPGWPGIGDGNSLVHGGQTHIFISYRIAPALRYSVILIQSTACWTAKNTRLAGLK